MICDSHIHIGEFLNGLHFTPSEIADWRGRCGIDKFLFFQPAQTHNYNLAYKKFLRDTETLTNLCGAHAYPALWMNLYAFRHCKRYFKEGFVALKFHPVVEKNLSDTDYEYVIKTSAELNRPLIIHTAYDAFCSCSRISAICEKCPETTVILAHGRPFENCINALKIPNVYADTAYMPPCEALKIVSAGYGDKLLFGSDFPIDRYFYPNENPLARYEIFKNNMQEILSSNALYNNFNRIFRT